MYDNLRRIFTGLACILYLILLGYTIAHHELWGDELHSWNIVKASPSLCALFHNMRYEGHPPLWYLILWPLTRVTHELTYMQVIQFVVAGTSMVLILYRAPLPLGAKLMAPFGYFLFYEYAAFSRNYAIGVLLAVCLCIVLERGARAASAQPRDSGAMSRRFRAALYYLLLLLLSNTHLLGLLLAFSFHVYFLWQRRKWSLHILGFLILLPAVYFILPPGDSQMNAGFWLGHWDLHRVLIPVEAPLRAFMPMPAWWEYHWWNTEFLLDVKGLNVVAAVVGPVLAWWALKGSRGGRVLFGVNVLVTLAAGLVFPLTSARYTGFLFIGFLAAYWVGAVPRARASGWPLLLLLMMALQLPGGLFAVWKDWRLPFSRANTAPELVGEVPSGAMLVCDYWALNPLAAFTDRAYYCIDLGETLSFLRWDGDFAARLRRPDRYVEGARALRGATDLTGALYLISTASPSELARAAGSNFRVHLEDFRDGAIEKGSNLYLYRIEMPGGGAGK